MTGRLPIYQVDAFTNRLFAGNPAAVVPLDSWLDDDLLLAIAAENNLSETAFFVPIGDAQWELRWFTPAIEVPLCGHATLASAFVIAEVLGAAAETLRFRTRRSGELRVTRGGDGWYHMDFPARPFTDRVDPGPIAAALGAAPDAVLFVPVGGDDTYLACFATRAAVEALAPDLAAVAALPVNNVIATAPDDSVDFVSRMFAPGAGIPEDPVTGSAHCALAPYWARELGKTTFVARQVSRRGGDLRCRIEGDRVTVSGQAVLFMRGEMHLPA